MASNAIKALKSFLKANGFKVRDMELEDSYKATKKEYRMASVCDLKWRAVRFCFFQSGFEEFSFENSNLRYAEESDRKRRSSN